MLLALVFRQLPLTGQLDLQSEDEADVCFWTNIYLHNLQLYNYANGPDCVLFISKDYQTS
jgi:hypothetical protein